MKKSFFSTAIYFVLAVALLPLGFFQARRKLVDGSDGKKRNPCAVRLWNIDTFEGGKGSRAAFLKGVALKFEKEREGAFVLVSSYTAEGAYSAMSEGNYPDMLSFGIGFYPPAEQFEALRDYSFFAAQTGNATYAVPWCRGGYAVYAKTEDFSSFRADRAVLSSGKGNLTGVAAAMEGFVGKFDEKDSTTAYVEFLNGKYDFLIGTQRDACRFTVRGERVYMRPVRAYSDLYQYIAVLSKTTEEQEICEAFLRTLLSEETQKTLSKIGMSSAFYDVYGEDAPYHDELEKATAEFAPSAFLSEAAIAALREEANAALLSGNAEVLKKFVKRA